MSLANDRRGRVPFAIVGVLLLVSASVYATGLASRGEPTVDRRASAALDATERDVRPTLRSAVRDAARDAATDPVTEPADTPTGRVLNDSSPFVDSLRVRIAVATRAAMERVNRRSGGVRTSVSLPPISGPSGLRRAKRDVTVTAVDGGDAMRVTIRNVSVRAHRDDRVVAERNLTVRLTVRTPVLALHERTTTYEERINRGPLEGAGLGRALTARLYPVTMARGYARYAGAPIENVLGNRHVGLSTNAALLAQQRTVFGEHDPDGARAVEVATVEVGVTDVLGPQNGDAASLAEAVLSPNAVDDGSEHTGRFEPEPPDAPPISSTPEAAADEAYLGLERDLSSVTAGSYRVDATLRTEVVDKRGEGPPAPDPPGDEWVLLSEETNERTAVSAVEGNRADGEGANQRDGPTVSTTRRVVVNYTTTRVWLHEGEMRTTTAQWRDEYRVAVEVRTAYAPADEAPNRATTPLFRRGGALDGPNLAGSRDRVATSLLAENGGVDAIAKRVAAGDGATLQREQSLVAERPPELEQWVAADLRTLRRAVANVSVNVSRRQLAAGDANPAAKLAERLRDRREGLVDAPQRYDGVADRARVAARVAYLERVIAALERRATATEARNRDYRDQVGDGAARRLAELVRVGTSGAEGRGGYGSGPTRGGDDRTLRTVPDASPAYLTLSALDRDHVPTVPPGETVHPLAVETTNWFALPYGDAADGIAGALFDSKRVSLETAAATLVAANRTAAAGAGTPRVERGTAGNRSGSQHPNRSEREAALAENRAALAEAVGRSVRRIERSVCVAARNGTALSRPACDRAVRDLRRRWPTLGHRGQAMSNGSYADAFASALVRRGVERATATEAGIRVRVQLRDLTAERRTSVPAATTNETATAARKLARTHVRRRLESGLGNASERAAKRLTGASRLPAGLPIAPPPYTWVATVNAWSVTVRGEYQRFALRSPTGAPDGGGGVVRYVRDGSTVRLDVDGDGEAERLGRNERVSFETETTVVAAVPPGPPGVGDVDGARTERSPGWPCPGAADRKPCEAVTGGGE